MIEMANISPATPPVGAPASVLKAPRQKELARSLLN